MEVFCAKNSSPKTIDYYLISVYSFNKYCNNPKLEDIDDELIANLILGLKEQIKAVSINSRLRGIRGILNYGAGISMEIPDLFE